MSLEKTDVDFESILETLGYSLNDRGEYWQTSALFRDGDNPTAIQIYKNSGVWKDYVEDSGFLPFSALVKKSNHDLSQEELKSILNNEATNESFINKQISSFSFEDIYSDLCLNDLLPHYKFYESKGVSKELLQEISSGLATKGQMYQRYVFPIRNEYKQIHGFAGRDMSNKDGRPKWKHVGKKSNWIYPHFNLKNKGYSQVLLVESVGDMLSIKTNSSHDCLVTFGLDVSPALITFLISINPQKIILSFNNDSQSSTNRGLHGSIKNYLKLLSYFDQSKIKICLPTKNDFGDMDKEDYNSFNNKLENIFDKDQRPYIIKYCKNNSGLSKALLNNLKKL
jgi:hypothetical protein